VQLAMMKRAQQYVSLKHCTIIVLFLMTFMPPAESVISTRTGYLEEDQGAEGCSSAALLDGISVEFLPFLVGKTCVSASRKLFPGIAQDISIDVPALFEEWWLTRKGDSVTFSDGSSYIWEGGRERYRSSGTDDDDVLMTAGLVAGFFQYGQLKTDSSSKHWWKAV